MTKPTQLDFIDLLQSSKRGKLKVYIGSVAGVGKTYRMLSDAHAMLKKNIDVVVGYVETHGRVETEKLLKGLEIIPRLKLEYMGVTIEEMDTDAILSRLPEVVIIDELPHTNVPTAKNYKRYLDVIEILLSGINVICALNIQHLESLNDIIYSATGVKVVETVPDNFFEYADQIVNIDLSVEDLIDRLKAGNIYSAENIEHALNNFFQADNISQLRELALREVAERLDNKKVEDQKPKFRSSSDRLMVYYQPQKTSQKFLMRKASRLAGKLNTDWIVLFVETEKTKIDSTDSQTQRNFYNDLQLAKELGANFIHINEKNVIEKTIEFALSENIKHIMLNSKVEAAWRWVFGKSLLKALIAIDKFDIHLSSNELIGNKNDS
jgi:two-component system sensor histidine kinase KdpD